MKRRLAEAVIATLRDDNVDEAAMMLKHFTVGDWQRSYRWLDASGLALYFLNKLESTGMAHCLPKSVRSRLTENREDNRAGSAELFREFTRINRTFQNVSLPYAALKGFSLVPDYCPDPSLRCQFDCDYLVRRADASRYAKELSSLGYQLTHADETEWQFKAGTDRLPSIRDLYKPKPQRSVELHFGVGHSQPADASDNDLLNRLRQQNLYGSAFPTLSPADMFLTQAFHLFRHIGGEWTRIAWLLEYRNFVLSQQDNSSLWEEVRTRAVGMENSAVAIGTATLLASVAFGEFAPLALTQWTVRALPDLVRLWIEHFGWNVLLANFPGTKLYLFLQRELIGDERQWKDFLRTRIVPLHRPVHQVVQSDDGAEGLRPYAFLIQLGFSAFRLRFHLIEALRYLVESRRWKSLRSSAARPWLHEHGNGATHS